MHIDSNKKVEIKDEWKPTIKDIENYLSAINSKYTYLQNQRIRIGRGILDQIEPSSIREYNRLTAQEIIDAIR